MKQKKQYVKLDIPCLFPISIKAICVAGMFMDSQDCNVWYWLLSEERKKKVDLCPRLITWVMEMLWPCSSRITNDFLLFFCKTQPTFCRRKRWWVQWEMTELSVPEFQRSQTPSEDLKNKENPVTENILLHSSFESLPLKVLRTSYFQYELAPGDLIKGTFLFQLANQKWSAEDFSDLEGSSETPPDSANFPDPRNQKTKMSHRPDWIWELGRQSSFIRKPGNLLRKGGKQINISSAGSYRFSSTELFQVRETAFMFERHLSHFLSR